MRKGSRPQNKKRYFWLNSRWVNFGLSVSVLLGLTLPLLVFPSETAAVLATIYAWIANTFGWFYILTGASTLALVLYIAFSRYGTIRLGSEEPEFPTLSWVGMLFAAGIGSACCTGVRLSGPTMFRRRLWCRAFLR